MTAYNRQSNERSESKIARISMPDGGECFALLFRMHFRHVSVPDQSPTNVRYKYGANRQLEVSWELPPIHNRNGAIIGFDAELTRVDGGRQMPTVKRVSRCL